MTNIFGPIITSTDVEDAVRATLQIWLDTMLGEVERQSGGRWSLRQITRPRTWHMVTDYRAPAADRKLPCVAIEAGPESRSYTGSGAVNMELGLDVIVVTKGQDREKTRETLSALIQAVLMVLEKHADLDEFASGLAVGEITRDVIPAEKAKTVAGARIPIAVVVPNVGSRWGGPEEPDDPPPVVLPPDTREWPAHTTTNIQVNDSLASSAFTPPYFPPAPGIGSFRATVDTFADLPDVGNVQGDARLVQDTNSIYSWDGANWATVIGEAVGNARVLKWDAGGEQFDHEEWWLDTSVPREFVGPVDPMTVLGIEFTFADRWTPTEEPTE